MRKIGILFLFGLALGIGFSWANELPDVGCTMEYDPVCAEIMTQCEIAPCPVIQKTFGNRCEMNQNKLAKFLYEGECKKDKGDIECPMYVPPSPDFCVGGKVVDGGVDENGCQMPPKCFLDGKLDITNCESYFDGCNFCSVVDGKASACTMMYCENPEEPKCLKYKEPVLNMANPASKFCEQNSGKLEILEGTGGQYGICKFIDGSKCEEWAFMRGECKPGYKKVHEVLDKYFDQNKKEFPTIEEKKTFLEGFVARIKLVSKGVKNGLWKTYRTIIKSIDLYFR